MLQTFPGTRTKRVTRQNITDLDRKIKRLVASNRLYTIFLDKWGCGAFDGGCLVLAQAIIEYLGFGTLKVVYLKPILDQNDYIPGHVIVQVKDYHIDGFGVGSWLDLTENWFNQECSFVGAIEDTTVEDCIGYGIPTDPFIVQALAAELERL